MIIRKEMVLDIEAITEVTTAAFKTLPISNHTEQFIINALRAANALTISLVAEIKEKVVGHIAFSPVTISDGSTGWYGLGPISVLPEYQKQGIGQSLMNEGLSMLKDLGGRRLPKIFHKVLSFSTKDSWQLANNLFQRSANSRARLIFS